MKIRVPLDQISNYMERHDLRLTDLLPREQWWDEADGEWHERMHPEARQTLKLWCDRLDRAEKQGWLDYYHADEFCVELLGLHPVQVFGEAWFEYPDDKDLQRRLRLRLPVEEVVEEAVAA